MFGRKDRVIEETELEEKRDALQEEHDQNQILSLAAEIAELKNNPTFGWVQKSIQREIDRLSSNHVSRLYTKPGTMTVDSIVADRVDMASEGGELIGLGFTERLLKGIIDQASEIAKKRNEIENEIE